MRISGGGFGFAWFWGMQDCGIQAWHRRPCLCATGGRTHASAADAAGLGQRERPGACTAGVPFALSAGPAAHHLSGCYGGRHERPWNSPLGAALSRRPVGWPSPQPLRSAMNDGTLVATWAVLGAGGGRPRGRRLRPPKAPWHQQAADAQAARCVRPTPGAVPSAPEPRLVTTPPAAIVTGLARARACPGARASRFARTCVRCPV